MVTPTDRVRILLVDDHTLFREGLREMLSLEDDLVVVGDVGDAERAVSVAAELRPDIILLDIEIPGSNVTSTLRAIRRASPESRVIILTMHDGAQLLQGLLALGINGYLLKNVTRQVLVSTIRSCLEEGRVMLSVSRRSLAQAEASSPATLSDRELEVLTLASRALSNTQIARELFLTEATVKRHLRNVFAKLGAVSRIDAVNKAVAASLLPTPQLGLPPSRPIDRLE
jgi:DNA-binding NarL/FixJ family response regulator